MKKKSLIFVLVLGSIFLALPAASHAIQGIGETAGATQTKGERCSGTALSYIGPTSGGDTEDGGTEANAETVVMADANDAYTDPSSVSPAWPAEFYNNPQNYCVESDLVQTCNPSGTDFGSGSCPFHLSVQLYSGSGIRQETTLDFNPNDHEQFYGTTTFTPPPPTATLTANPATINLGGTSGLSWSSVSTKSCTLYVEEGSTYKSLGAVATSSAAPYSVSPTSSTKYALTCDGEAAGVETTAYATVTVNPPPLPTATLAPAHQSITQGNSASLNYVCTNSSLATLNNGVGLLRGTEGTVTVSPTVSTTYTLTCTGINGATTTTTGTWVDLGKMNIADDSGSAADVAQEYALPACPSNPTGACTTTGSNMCGNYSYPGVDENVHEYECEGPSSTKIPTATASATVSVTQPTPAPTCSLSATATTIVKGSSSTLKWSSTNTTSTSGINFSTGGATSGSAAVSPTVTTTYKATCTGAGGSTTSAPVTITVTQPTPPNSTVTATCSVSPTAVTTGQSVTWTAVPAGGNGTYTYAWSGTGGLSGTTKSVSKSYSGTGTQTGNVTVTSNGHSTGAVDCSNSVSVTSQLPDVTAGTVSPTTATVGSPVTFSSTVSDPGTGAAPSFPSIIEIGGSSNVHATNSVHLDAGGTATISASASYTFASVGTYQVRACANMNASMVNIISESNYSNNCGSWASVIVSAATTPPGGGSNAAVSCAPSSATTATGDSVTWTPQSSGFTGTVSYTWSGSGGSPSSGSGSSYTNSYAVAGNYSPTVTAKDSKGDSASASCVPVIITGSGGPGGACKVATSPYIKATPNLVNPTTNTGVTLSWSAVGVAKGTSCVITGPSLTPISTPAAGSSCVIATSTAPTGAITTQSVYTINCGGPTATAVVNVIPAYNEY
jgi:hypothetical protein